MIVNSAYYPGEYDEPPSPSVWHRLNRLPLVLGGCQPPWRSQFPNGAELSSRMDHQRFGKVVGYEASHDFHNGTAPEPAILIEQDSDHTSVWGSCATCAATFDVKTP